MIKNALIEWARSHVQAWEKALEKHCLFVDMPGGVYKVIIPKILNHVYVLCICVKANAHKVVDIRVTILYVCL